MRTKTRTKTKTKGKNKTFKTNKTLGKVKKLINVSFETSSSMNATKSH